jgi:hypothetical protein
MMNETMNKETVNAMNNVFSLIQRNNLADDAKQVIGHDDDGNEISIVKKTVRFEIAKGKRAQVDISNPDIINSVDKINAARHGADIMSYVICRELANLQGHEEELQKMGFDDVADFGRSVFGYSRNTVNQYVRVGKAFILPDYSVMPALPSTISVSAMLEILAYVQKDGGALDVQLLSNLYNNGILADGMSTKTIRDSLLKWSQSNALEAGQEGTEDSKQDESKQGKKRGRKAKADVSQQGQESAPTSIIDRLNDMTPDAAAGNALNALEILNAIFDKFAGENEKEVWEGSIEMLKDIARQFVK